MRDRYRDSEKTKCSCLETKSSRFENPIDKIRRWRRNCVYIYQRIIFGYCDRDVRSIDVWFLRIFPYMLDDLRTYGNVYPDELLSEVINEQGIPDYEREKEAHRRWNDILRRMAFLFREANEDVSSRVNSYEEQLKNVRCKIDIKKRHSGKKLLTPSTSANTPLTQSSSDISVFRDFIQNWIDEEKELDEYRDQCKDEALELFQKWFWALWM